VEGVNAVEAFEEMKLRIVDKRVTCTAYENQETC
jgi:mannitol-1-phosphate/altronate dehydrogenase